MDFSKQTTGNLALALETPQLQIVEKAQVEIGIGSVISYQWGNQRFELPILGIRHDLFGRVAHYTVPALFPEHGVWSKIAATDSVHILSISAPKALDRNTQWLLLAAQLAGAYVKLEKEAQQYKPMAITLVSSVVAVKTHRGYGLHDELESELMEGDKAKYEALMAEAQTLKSMYWNAIEAYKQGRA